MKPRQPEATGPQASADAPIGAGEVPLHVLYLRLRQLCHEVAERVREPLQKSAFPDIASFLAQIALVTKQTGYPLVPILLVGPDQQEFECLLDDLAAEAIKKRSAVWRPRQVVRHPALPPVKPAVAPVRAAQVITSGKGAAAYMLETMRLHSYAVLQLVDPYTGWSQLVSVFWGLGIQGIFWKGKYIELGPPASQTQQRQTVRVMMERWVRHLDAMLEEATLAVANSEPQNDAETFLKTGRRRKRPRLSAEKYEQAIDYYLKKHPEAKVRDIANDLGYSIGTVSESMAWHKHGHHRDGKHKKISLGSGVNADGAKPATQWRRHEERQSARDDDIDRDEAQLKHRIMKFKAKNPGMTDQQVARELKITAGDVEHCGESMDANLAKLNPSPPAR